MNIYSVLGVMKRILNAPLPSRTKRNDYMLDELLEKEVGKTVQLPYKGHIIGFSVKRIDISKGSKFCISSFDHVMATRSYDVL